MSSVKNKSVSSVKKGVFTKEMLGLVVPILSSILIGALLITEIKKKARVVSEESDETPVPKKKGIYNFRRKPKVVVRQVLVRRASDPGLPLKRKLVLVKKSDKQKN